MLAVATNRLELTLHQHVKGKVQIVAHARSLFRGQIRVKFPELF